MMKYSVMAGVMLSGFVAIAMHAAPGAKKAETFQCELISKLGQIQELEAPIILMFYASWCPSCHKMIAAFNEFLALNPDLSAYRIDVGGSGQALGQKFDVSGIPTMVIVERDEQGRFKEIKRFVGTLSLEELKKKVAPVVCPVSK